jgi:hypothetical protein
MNSYFKAFLACSLILLYGSIAFGQESPTNASSTIAAHENGMERIPPVVTGMPYSAVTETETVQAGADGTRFDHKMARTKTYRDSQGRTRIERYMPTGFSNSDPPAVLSVTIRDPVAGVEYFLNPREHTARQVTLHLPPPGQRTQPAVVSESEIKPRNNRPQTKITVEDLGTQVIDGLLVEGNRTTMTFPPDAQGNDKPFDVVTERWFSKELETYILIKTNDPRSGEHTIKTTIADRGEPDPSLFQVPADYTIEQK